MKKVTIEITENGWETKVELDGEVFVEKHRRSSFGAEGVEGNFEDNDELSEELYEALSDFTQYDVMQALSNQ